MSIDTLNDPRPAQDLRELERDFAEAQKEADLYEADKILMLSALNGWDANRYCGFAPEVTDFARAPRGPMGIPCLRAAPKRRPKLHEVVQEILLPDSIDQHGLSEMVQLMLNAASGKFSADDLFIQANQFIGSLSVMYAEQQAEGRKV